MVKRLIALTATAVCTLAVSASAAESDNAAPPAPSAPSVVLETRAAAAPQVLALQALDNAKLDEATAKIEAAIEQLRAAGDIDGVNKDDLIAQLQAAADSLKADAPQVLELQRHLGDLQGLEDKQVLRLRELTPGAAPQVYNLDPKTIEQLTQMYQLDPQAVQELKELAPNVNGQDIHIPHDEGNKELILNFKFTPDATVAPGEAPHAFVFTPEQIEELKAQALAGADAARQVQVYTPADPALHAKIAQLVQSHQLTEAQVAELHARIEALVEQYIAEHAADAATDNATSCEDSKD